ncbi:MAG: hypothetical protein CXT78_13015 [Thaumarchaeota archaeon]|jgi:hypothetical protein|nr:MAG: hypothetical protein CXT78_13015 [Nitrososphaerota archaeon]HIE46485.1 hypothetical protein [Nitrosopumilus sp.]
MSQDNVIWSDNLSLLWSDFKAEFNPASFEDSHCVIKYQFTWTINSEKTENKILFFIENIQLTTEFNPLLSWVRHLQNTDALLLHEQGHFDLGELVKRENLEKLRNLFYEKQFATRGKNEDQQKQFAKEDSGKMIAMEIEKLEQMLSCRRKIYDDETDFGKNSEKQSEYDNLFAKLKL